VSGGGGVVRAAGLIDSDCQARGRLGRATSLCLFGEFVMRHASTLTCLGLFVSCGLAMTGCRSEPGLWSLNYKDWSNYPGMERQPEDVSFERVMSLDELRHLPQQEGLIIIGSARFTTAPVLEPDGDAPDRTLRQLAARKGADVVRWAGRTIEYGSGNWEDRHEYLAVFYTYEWAQSVGLTFKNPDPSQWQPAEESGSVLASEPVDLDF